jgi:hypothetical protein
MAKQTTKNEEQLIQLIENVKNVMNETLDYTNTSILKIKTAGGFLYRLWFLISAPIIWLIKGEIKIK